MVRFLFLLLLFITNVSAQTLYCGQDTGLSAKVTLSNLTKYSQEIDNAEWLSSATTETANSVIAPDGTLTADTLTASAGASAHYIYSAATNRPAAGTTERVSFYIKKGTHRYFGVFDSVTNAYGLVLDLDAPTSPYHVTSLSDYSISAVGNGWYRVVIEFTKTAGATRIIYLSLRQDTTSSAVVPSWTAVGTETVYLWGIQLNNQADPIDYLATTSAAATLAGVCASGTTQSPTDPSKCIPLGNGDIRKW